MLETYGLHELVWGACDERFSDILVASPADAGGRGISLAARENGGEEHEDGFTLFLEAINAYENATEITTDAAAAANAAAALANTAAGNAGQAVADLQAAAQAGDFDDQDGADGFSPSATVAQTTTGATGPQGPAGDDGEDATITGASATVDATTGTPSVNVTLGETASMSTGGTAIPAARSLRPSTPTRPGRCLRAAFPARSASTRAPRRSLAATAPHGPATRLRTHTSASTRQARRGTSR